MRWSENQTTWTYIARARERVQRLVALHPAGWAEDEITVALCAIHRPDAVLGPAHRWLLQELSATCAQALKPHHPNR
ncbi:MAG TPA: hypothetical protein VGS80_15225 [Ktedonobacterales bacterium]|nr:hypothetical protein [Ktedonobacterales bacterium]